MKSVICHPMIAVLVCGAAVLGGCGARHIDITYDALNKVDTPRQGTVVVRTFVDSRGDGSKGERVGVVRNGYGMDIGKIMPPKNTTLMTEVTRCFAEALESAGYTVLMESESAAGHPILTGEVTRFWVDTYMAVWHDTHVTLSLVSPSAGQTMWTKPVKGHQKNVLVWGSTKEFQKTVTAANTKALNQAQMEFVSSDFYKCIKKP